MTEINVGIDFDEPIYPWYDLAHKAVVAAGRDNGVLPVMWAPYKEYGITQEDWVSILDAEVLKDDDGMYHQIIDPKVVEQVKRLYNRGFNIHIITARGQFGELGERIKEITKSCIIRSGLPYTTLNFAKNKVPVAQSLGIDYFLDDAPHNHEALIQAGINSYLLDAKWNQDDDDYGKRVYSLKEFCDMILDEQAVANNAYPQALTQSQRHHVRNNAQFIL